MKKRLHGKKVGIALLLSLLIISVLEWIFRIVCIREDLVSTPNAGEPLAVAIFAALLLIFTLKGKDRVSYVCFGAWMGYFVLDQLFDFPGMLANFAANISNPVVTASIVIRLLTMISIIAIGALLLEYINDGTIYNRAFNALCIITVVLLTVSLLWAIYQLVFASVDGAEIVLLKKQNMLVIFNNIYRIMMVFLCTFFAYDSAKLQLKKANLAK